MSSLDYLLGIEICIWISVCDQETNNQCHFNFVFLAFKSIWSKLPSFCFSLQLLSKPKFNVVEKIKTIGTTYMAAAGLTNPTTGEERKVRKQKLTNGKMRPTVIKKIYLI